MASRHDAKLKKLQQLWKKTRSEVGDSTGGFELLPEGLYTAKLVEPKIIDEPSKKLQVGFRVEILDGDFAGKKIFHSWNLENEIGMSMFMQFLNLCGYVDFDDLMQLKEIVDELEALNAVFEIRVKVRDGYNRVSFNNIIETDPDPEDDDEPEEEEKPKRSSKKTDPDPEDDDEPEEEEKPKRSRRKKSEEKSDEYSKEDDEFLRDLCDGFGVSHRAIKTTAELVEKLKSDHAGEFVEDDLEEEEIEKLKKLNLKSLIG